MSNRVKSQELVYGRTSGGVNVPVQVDAAGIVQVGGAGGGGTSSTFGATFPSGGTAAGASDGTNMQPLKVDGSGNLKVAILSGGGSGIAPSASARSRIVGSTSSQTALASNASRVGAAFVNEGDVKCYLKFGAVASVT